MRESTKRGLNIRNLYILFFTLISLHLTANSDSESAAIALHDTLINIYFQELEVDIPMTMNDEVRYYIHDYIKCEYQTEKIIGASFVYFPIIENIFFNSFIPEDLKYITLVESFMNHHAVSPVGAVGLWQFMKPTGQELGLTVNDQIDERRDPILATHAAGKYLYKLHEKYDDWLLVIAAYNAGITQVNRAIKKAKNDSSYWKIRKYLPKETSKYIPKLLAAIYIVNNYAKHGMEPNWPSYSFSYIDEVSVESQLSMKEISMDYLVEIEKLTFINPAILTPNIDSLWSPIMVRIPGIRKKIRNAGIGDYAATVPIEVIPVNDATILTKTYALPSRLEEVFF